MLCSDDALSVDWVSDESGADVVVLLAAFLRLPEPDVLRDAVEATVGLAALVAFAALLAGGETVCGFG